MQKMVSRLAIKAGTRRRFLHFIWQINCNNLNRVLAKPLNSLWRNLHSNRVRTCALPLKMKVEAISVKVFNAEMKVN
jgi:hypothetical protein